MPGGKNHPGQKKKKKRKKILFRFYLLPIETVIIDLREYRGPKYLKWRFNPLGIDCVWAGMDYGFVPYMLVSGDLAAADHDAIVLNSDVYLFPENLDGPVDDQGVDVFFEGINIPTDWLTPATTWRELLRQLAGMFQFNQRYAMISGGHSVFENATLETRLRQMTAEEQAWFLQTVESFGFDPGIVSVNSRLRQLVKTAGNFWENQEFKLGAVVF